MPEHTAVDHTAALAPYRAEFPITEQCTFLSHAAISSPSRRVSSAIQHYVEQVATQPFLTWINEIIATSTELRESLRQLINARSTDELVAQPNTAYGINTAAVSLPLQPGDNVIVLEGDYPANTYPWQSLAYRGILTKFVPKRHGGLDLALLERRIDRRTRVIALSTAMFANGFRNNIAAVGQLCKERGIYFVVDAIQTLGAFPLDVQACHIDMLACGSQKWLLSTPGYGFLYCRRELFAELQPGAYVGANSVVDPMNYLDYNFTLPETAERFNLGTPNLPGMVALRAAVKLLHEVGIERINQQILYLVDVLINDLSTRGYQFAASTAPEHRSGIVVIKVPEAAATCDELKQYDLIVTARGEGLRIAPHFYNTPDEMLRVGHLLEICGCRPA